MNAIQPNTELDIRVSIETVWRSLSSCNQSFSFWHYVPLWDFSYFNVNKFSIFRPVDDIWLPINHSQSPQTIYYTSNTLIIEKNGSNSTVGVYRSSLFSRMYFYQSFDDRDRQLVLGFPFSGYSRYYSDSYFHFPHAFQYLVLSRLVIRNYLQESAEVLESVPRLLNSQINYPIGGKFFQIVNEKTRNYNFSFFRLKSIVFQIFIFFK